MQLIETSIPDVKVFKPRVFGDERGFFMESFNQRVFQELTNLDVNFVQDNHSRSAKNVLRGLHYQIEQAQGKLVRVIAGEVIDVAVDLRRHSPFFGQHVARRLSAENHEQMWIPAGFAHGFYVLSDNAEFLYKTTDYYSPQHERTIRWDDTDLSIDWSLNDTPVVSEKDSIGLAFTEAEVFE